MHNPLRSETEMFRVVVIVGIAAAPIVALGLIAGPEWGAILLAIEDTLRTFAADEVIISTHPPERSRWLEQGVVERAERDVPLPVAHVIVDLEAERAAGTAA